jgi:hypothetical protein
LPADEFIENLFSSGWSGGNPSGGKREQNYDNDTCSKTLPVTRLRNDGTFYSGRE